MSINRFRRIVVYLDKSFTRLERMVEWTYWMYVVLVLLFVYEVVNRYFFSNPHDWFLEVSITIGVWCGFLGCATVTFERRHITLDLLFERLQEKGRSILDLINSIAGVIVSSVLNYFVIKQIQFLNEIDARYQTSLELPKSVAAYGAFVGLTLCVVFFIGRIFRNLNAMTSGIEG